MAKTASRMMNTRKKRAEDDDWLVTYSDMVTLLLTFFVMLVSISRVDVVLFEQVKAGISKGVGKKDITTPVEALKIDVEDTIQTMKIDDIVGLGTDNRGIVIDFASAAFFEPGSATIRAEALPILERIAATLQSDLYSNFQVEVAGHTDDVPINTPQFPSNWELSALRATNVVREFEDEGVAKDRLKAIAYADVVPLVPNKDALGNPDPEAQEINRRIAVHVYPRLRGL